MTPSFLAISPTTPTNTPTIDDLVARMDVPEIVALIQRLADELQLRAMQAAE